MGNGVTFSCMCLTVPRFRLVFATIWVQFQHVRTTKGYGPDETHSTDDALTAGGLRQLFGHPGTRAPERFSFHPAVNIVLHRMAHVLGAMKSSCDSRSQSQVTRSKQPAYSLALPGVCTMVSGVNQPLARWAVNYRGLFPKRSGTRRILPTG